MRINNEKRWPAMAVCCCLMACSNAQSSLTPRWGAASWLADDVWFVAGGKSDTTDNNGLDNAPNINHVVSLDLSASFRNADADWQTVQTHNAPAIAWHTVNSLSNTTALQFGGDETDVALPAGADSAYLLSPSTDSLGFAQEADGWASQPTRRVRHTAATVLDGDLAHVYVYGGLRNDNAGVAFSELWRFTTCANSTSSCAEDPTWVQITAGNSPPPLLDHTSTLLQLDGQLVLVLVGGIDATNSLLDLSPITTIYVFVFDSDMTSGTWTTINASGEAPLARHGHIAAPISSDTILIHGGASGDNSEVYGDLALLTFDGISAASWSTVSASGSTAPSRFFHSGALVGDQLVLGFGYGEDGPVDTDLYTLDTQRMAWMTSFSANTGTGTPSPSSTNGQSVTASASASAGATSTNTRTSQSPGTSTSTNGRTTTSQTHSTATNSQDSIAPDTTSRPDDQSQSSNHTPIIVGTVVGVFALGALAIGMGYYLYRRRTSRYYGGGGGAALLYPAGASDNDDLLNEKPSRFSHIASSGTQLFGALLGQPKQKENPTRWDILADEEDDVWDPTDHAALAPGGRVLRNQTRATSGGWQDAPLAEQDDELRNLTAPELEEEPRGWSAFAARSREQVDSAMQGWRDPRSGSPRLGHGPAPSGPRAAQLMPMPLGRRRSTDSDMAGSSAADDSRAVEDRYSDLDHTASTVPVSFFSSGDKSHTAHAPSSPSTPKTYDALQRSTSWWGRFTKNVASPAVPIRDPQKLAIVTEQDPFADPDSLGSSSGNHTSSVADTDEHGHWPSAAHALGASQSSAVTSSTSVLEDMGNMVVQQHYRSVSGSIASSTDSPNPDSDSGSAFGGHTPLGEEGAVVWAGADTTPMLGHSPSLDNVVASPALVTSPKIRRVPQSPGSGVMAMVQEFEKRASGDLPRDRRKKGKIVSTLAPRETLFVANPDDGVTGTL